MSSRKKSSNIFCYKCLIEISTKTKSFVDKKNYDQSFNENEKKDQLYKNAIELVKSEGKASTSFLQRKLQIGYNRAARIIDMMEDDGIVGKANHVGKREILQV